MVAAVRILVGVWVAVMGLLDLVVVASLRERERCRLVVGQRTGQWAEGNGCGLGIGLF